MTKAQRTIKKKAKDEAKRVLSDKSLKRRDRVAQAEAIKAEAEAQITRIDQARNVSDGTRKCYVCGKPIKSVIVYIGADMYRHAGCFAGSPRWMDSETGKNSKYFSLFANKEED